MLRETIRAEWAACCAKRRKADLELHLVRQSSGARILREAVKIQGEMISEVREATKAAEEREAHLQALIDEAAAEPPTAEDLAALDELAKELEEDGDKLRVDLEHVEREEAVLEREISTRNLDGEMVVGKLQPKLDMLASQVTRPPGDELNHKKQQDSRGTKFHSFHTAAATSKLSTAQPLRHGSESAGVQGRRVARVPV